MTESDSPTGQIGGKRKGAGRPKGSGHVAGDRSDHYTILAKAKAEREVIRALREKLAYRREAGELYDRSEVMRTFTTTVAVFSEQMRTIPDLLERNSGLTPMQAIKAEDVINTQLAELKAKLIRTFRND